MLCHGAIRCNIYILKRIGCNITCHKLALLKKKCLHVLLLSCLLLCSLFPVKFVMRRMRIFLGFQLLTIWTKRKSWCCWLAPICIFIELLKTRVPWSIHEHGTNPLYMKWVRRSKDIYIARNMKIKTRWYPSFARWVHNPLDWYWGIDLQSQLKLGTTSIP